MGNLHSINCFQEDEPSQLNHEAIMSPTQQKILKSVLISLGKKAGDVDQFIVGEIEKNESNTIQLVN